MTFSSFIYAFEGLKWSFTHHRNFQVHSVIALTVFLMAAAFGVSKIEWTILTFAVLLGFITEMVNTAIEEITNLITIKWAHQAKIAKDVSAGMMLLTALATAIIGLIIFIPYVLVLL